MFCFFVQLEWNETNKVKTEKYIEKPNKIIEIDDFPY